MLLFNIPKEYPELAQEISQSFGNSEIVEVDSLSADTIIQVIVPFIQVSIPALTGIIINAISVSSKVEVEWNGIKIKGTEKQVEKFLNKIIALDVSSSKGGKNEQKEASHDSK